MIQKRTGVAIPVFALKSEKSFGVGEFEDLRLMVDWCVRTNQNIIQLLPINDTTFTHTWEDSYPYSACSSYALHPQFLRLSEIGVDMTPYEQERIRLNALEAYDYEAVNNLKIEIAAAHYAAKGKNDCRTKAFKAFVEANKDWLVPYAEFCVERDGKKYTVAFYEYLQYHLDKQLKGVVEYAHSKGVLFKGDLPIGVDRDSCDVKQFPELFNLDGSAGAPPDFFSRDGQNWGFPTYNWEEMAKDGYAWWKRRLGKMSEYFDAFRIDHILGFFRIWEIPVEVKSGLLGHFNPALPLSPEEMRDRFGFNFYECQTYPFGHECADLTLGTDVLFLEDKKEKGKYHPRILGHDTQHYAALSWDQKEAFNRLYDDFFFRRHNEFWKGLALEKLPPLLGSTHMIACGEDLGMIPACVPEVMRELGILSLEIQTMPKSINEEFANPAYYPEMSVCTTSTHDMMPLRAWWESDREGKSRRFFYDYLHWQGECPWFAEDWLIRGIFEQHFASPSVYKIFPLQDYLALSSHLRRVMPLDERINDPANPKHYWHYRMHLTLEQLLSEDGFNDYLGGMVAWSLK